MKCEIEMGRKGVKRCKREEMGGVREEKERVRGRERKRESELWRRGRADGAPAAIGREGKRSGGGGGGAAGAASKEGKSEGEGEG